MPWEGFKQDARRVLKARQTHEIRKKRGRKKKVGRKRGKPKKKRSRREKEKMGCKILSRPQSGDHNGCMKAVKKKGFGEICKKKKKIKMSKKKEKRKEKRKKGAGDRCASGASHFWRLSVV